MAEDLKNKPNNYCAAYKAMERAWAIMRDTCAGTLHLRDQGSGYLPMEPAEDTRDFEIRRSRAIFFNAVERTLHGLVGLVFWRCCEGQRALTSVCTRPTRWTGASGAA